MKYLDDFNINKMNKFENSPALLNTFLEGLGIEAHQIDK